jgi:hypothetical protein
MHRLAFAVFAAALLIINADPALAAPCASPAWFRDGGLKGAAGELIGMAKHADVSIARRDARRDVGRRIVKERGRDILAWPAVRGKVNLQVYSETEVARALAQALAVHLPDGRRLKSELACGSTHVAVAIDKKDAYARLREAPDLGEDVAMALAGKVDRLEERRRDGEQRTLGTEYTDAAKTADRLLKLAKTMRAEVLLESLMTDALERRGEALAAELATARTVSWEEDRRAALARAGESALSHEKLIAALRAYKSKDYAAAADTFRILGVEGDELAQTALAILHLEAKGVRRDPGEALALLKKAAAKSYGPAKVMLGTLHLSGLGTKPSPSEAAKWFTSADVDGWTCEVEVRQCRHSK